MQCKLLSPIYSEFFWLFLLSGIGGYKGSFKKLQPISEFCSMCEDEIYYDFIIKYENLKTELNYLVDRLSIKREDSNFLDQIDDYGINKVWH